MSVRTVHKFIRVHPPEADAVCGAFGRVRSDSEAILARLNTLRLRLDQEWEGNQQSVFQQALEDTIERLARILLPQLRLWETKYRNFTVEEEIEVVEEY
jgi:uncharacterized protein YukE